MKSTRSLAHRNTASLINMIQNHASPSNTFDDRVEMDSIGRATILQLLSFKRPWFRSFHLSWLSLFLAFLGWFSFAPVLPYLIEQGLVTSKEAKISSIAALAGSVFLKFLIGPLCDAFGPKRVTSILLLVGGILVCLSSTVYSYEALVTMRCLIGILGGVGISTQFWIMMMFSDNVIGTAAALSAGWGNMGIGIGELLIPGIIKALIKNSEESGISQFTAWRYAMLVPGFIITLFSIPVWVLSDDCPQGNWEAKVYNTERDEAAITRVLAKKQNKQNVGAEERSRLCSSGYVIALKNVYVWIVAFQCAICAGIELSMGNTLPDYYRREFPKTGCHDNSTICATLSIEDASMIASVFGITNIFGRVLGGYISDRLFILKGLRGRLLAVFILLLFQAIFMLIFSFSDQVVPSAVFLAIFSTFSHMAKGALIALVPFLLPDHIASVLSIVAAGGTFGAVVWSVLFVSTVTYRESYVILSVISIVGSFASFFCGLEDPKTSKNVYILSSCLRKRGSDIEFHQDPSNVPNLKDSKVRSNSNDDVESVQCEDVSDNTQKIIMASV